MGLQWTSYFDSRTLLFLLVWWAAVFNARFVYSGQPISVPERVSKLEDQIESVVTRVRPATVALLSRGGHGSGVIVSPEGHVLTAGHCIDRPNMPYDIRLPDGRSFKAVSLGFDLSLDCGLIKILEPENLPFAKLGQSSLLQVGDGCISLGHSAAYNPKRGPVVRFGRIITPISKNNGFIQSSCLMEPGDSGGPLFDMRGNVIGIHSQCGRSLGENFEVAADVFRRYWPQLNEPKQFNAWVSDDEQEEGKSESIAFGIEFRRDTRSQSFPVAKIKSIQLDSWAESQGLLAKDTVLEIDGQKVENGVQANWMLYRALVTSNNEFNLNIRRNGKRTPLKVSFRDFPIPELPKGLSEIADINQAEPDRWNVPERLIQQFSIAEGHWDDSVVLLDLVRENRTLKLPATVVKLDGRVLLITKLSSAGDDYRLNGVFGSAELSVVISDRLNDLLILEPSKDLSNVTPLEIDIDDNAPQPAVQLGKFLITAHPTKSGRVGVLGASQFELGARGVLGVRLDTRGPSPAVLDEVFEGSAASKSGLKVGDMIVSVDGSEIRTSIQLVRRLRKYRAGQELEFIIQRDEDELVEKITLGKPSDSPGFQPRRSSHIADYFPGGRNRVAEGFESVLVHDTPIRPNECGTPVFTTDGEFLGINIARVSRTRAYILPLSIILNSIAKS